MAVVMEDEWMYQQAAQEQYEQDQRVLEDRILGQTTGLLAQRGDEQAVALLVDVRSMALVDTDEVIRTEQVPDIMGLLTGDDSLVTRRIYRRAAVLDVDDYRVPWFTDEICQRIAATLSYVAERNGEHDVAYVRARPALPEAEGDWRAAHAARLAEDRPSNQARRERTQAGKPVEDGLFFGSAEELQVYRALKTLQARCREDDTIAIAPLPGVYLRSGNTRSPDVLVIGKGRALIVETDGPHHRALRRWVDDKNRDQQWLRCGVHVVRLAVEDLHDDDALYARLREEVQRYLRRDG
jgi:hypothetical protein